MYFVYLIRNKRRGELYFGYTNNLLRRFKEHKDKQPDLIYCEMYKSRKDAILREQKLKQRGQSVRWLKERAKYSLEE